MASESHLSAGIGPKASFLSHINFHNSSGEFTFPGNLHPIPMIAKGSRFLFSIFRFIRLSSLMTASQLG